MILAWSRANHTHVRRASSPAKLGATAKRCPPGWSGRRRATSWMTLRTSGVVPPLRLVACPRAGVIHERRFFQLQHHSTHARPIGSRTHRQPQVVDTFDGRLQTPYQFRSAGRGRRERCQNRRRRNADRGKRANQWEPTSATFPKLPWNLRRTALTVGTTSQVSFRNARTAPVKAVGAV